MMSSNNLEEIDASDTQTSKNEVEVKTSTCHMIYRLLTKPLTTLRENMNGGFDERLLISMKVTLSIGEFCLLLLVLVVLLEVSPSDIPKTCPSGVHEACIDRLIEIGGPDSLDEDDGALTCGVIRANCWRGAYKLFLYREGHLPSGTKNINISDLGLPPNVLDAMEPRLEYCQCLLTLNGTVALPSDPQAWRQDTDFFCETLNSINAGIGAMGFFIGTALVLFKSTLDDMGDDASKIISFYLILWLFVFSLIWVVWNTFLIYSTRKFGYGVKYEIECELPESQMFYYVFNIALLSLVAGVLFFLMNMIFAIGCTKPGKGYIPEWRNKILKQELKRSSLVRSGF